MSLPEKIRLVDNWRPLTDAWTEVFSEHASVVVACGDFFSQAADAMVSPANSFGIMNGGLDLAIRTQVGGDIQRRVQSVILERYHGEMPVGTAEIVETASDRWRFLVVAPTMRVPEPVSNTLNAYLSFRAILVAVRRFNEVLPRIRSLLVPGLATGVGGYGCSPLRGADASRLRPSLWSGAYPELRHDPSCSSETPGSSMIAAQHGVERDGRLRTAARALTPRRSPDRSGLLLVR